MEHSFEDFNIITPDPHLLLHSNIPKPLHEVNPRTIKGRNWWDEQRRRIYSEQGDRCAACGVHKSQAKGKKKWLECHEIYEIDWKRGTAKFIKLIALCPYCHMFIHNGRMQALYDQGEISTRQYFAVIKHGTELLDKAGIRSQWEHRHDACNYSPNWNKWRLIFEGKKYKPKFKSYDEWLKHFGYKIDMTPKASPFFNNARISDVLDEYDTYEELFGN